MIAFDWTDFAKDDQSTLALSVIARGGRATPVPWKTVQRTGILRHSVEDELLERHRAALLPPIRITLLADRRFASQAMYLFLRAPAIDFVALAQTLLHVLGAAGESLGMDRLLKVITVKTPVHSLYAEADTLLLHFRRFLHEHATIQQLFALL